MHHFLRPPQHVSRSVLPKFHPENEPLRLAVLPFLAFATMAQAATVEIHYAPTENLEAIDVALLDNAEHCIDMVMQHCELTLCGNHDEALLRGAHDFNPVARQVIDYNRRMLKPTLLYLIVLGTIGSTGVRRIFVLHYGRVLHGPPSRYHSCCPPANARESLLQTRTGLPGEASVRCIAK